MHRTFLPAAVLAGLLLAGCATGRKLPPYEKPLARTPVQSVRTTAYTHTESDHRKYGARSAAGTPLRRGGVNSAAADWSRWPLGTRFQLVETGEIYEVDDYGWMLAGTNTIDLYQPTRAQMNKWGVRRVTIEVLEWGDPQRSYAMLKPRSKHRHVKRMVRQLEDRYEL
ncbi:MAG: 3D domain-containing protein [Chthoniobacterales bacterium]|nr:3D domain-containing protein [Chthoniobacterales bacterium]